jgi:hypothetical protein
VIAGRAWLAGVALTACALGCDRGRTEGHFDGAVLVAPSDAILAAADIGSSAVGALDKDTSARPDADMTAGDSSSEHAPDPLNKAKPPLTSPDLDERAAHLIDALVRDDPAVADDFFFPRAPFIPLKDVADPGRYFDQLLATYHRDIRSLHAERKDWTGATFVSFELGTPPTWVAPGKEYNKIGYFRTFGGKLRYRVGDKTKEIAVSTIISWDGRWYVTHLSPIRH